MNRIKLGSLCSTKITKTFKIKSKNVVIPKETYVIVCDDTYVSEGYVLIESEGYGYALDYKLDELTFIE